MIDRKTLSKTIVLAVIVSAWTSGCAHIQLEPDAIPPPQAPVATNHDEGNRPEANESSKESGPPRGFLLRQQPDVLEAAAAPVPAPPMPRYGKARLLAAGQVKAWSAVKPDGMDVTFGLKTRWKDGQIFMRVAAIGRDAELQAMVSNVKEFKIAFYDSGGAELNYFRITGRDLTPEAKATKNNGMPTYVFESSVECPLSEYEQYRTWVISWQ
jgi:hypothetical protein